MNWKYYKKQVEQYLDCIDGLPTDVRRLILRQERALNSAHNALSRGTSYEALCYLPCARIFDDTAEALGHPAYCYEPEERTVEGRVYQTGCQEYDAAKARWKWFERYCEVKGVVADSDFGDCVA
jgi:hypothetical protein